MWYQMQCFLQLGPLKGGQAPIKAWLRLQN